MKSDKLTAPIALLLMIPIAVTLGACNGSAITDAGFEEGRFSLKPGETQDGQTGFRVGRGTLIVEGDKHVSRLINLHHDGPHWLFMLWVNGRGLFLVGIDPLDLSIEAGQFAGNVLEFECDGTRVTLTSEEGPILRDGVNRPAWLIHLPAFEMFDSGIKPADRVIGMIENLRQIPRFEKNELDPNNCRGALVEL